MHALLDGHKHSLPCLSITDDRPPILANGAISMLAKHMGCNLQSHAIKDQRLQHKRIVLAILSK